MKWMTVEYARTHSRIDYNDEDALLELYLNAAEEAVLNYIDRTYEEVIEIYGEIPANLYRAALLATDTSYQFRSLVAQGNLSPVPHGTFDSILRKYMKLSDGGDIAPYQEVVLGSQIKIPFKVEVPHGHHAKYIGFSVTVRNFSDKDKCVKFKKKECIRLGHGEYAVPVDTEALGIGVVRLKLTLHIPDRDFPGGYRKEVVNINPRISIKG